MTNKPKGKHHYDVADRIRGYKGDDEKLHKILDEFFKLSASKQRNCLAYLMGRISVINA